MFTTIKKIVPSTVKEYVRAGIYKIIKPPAKSGNEIYRKSFYSQAGEDIILMYLFNSVGISTPAYLDIGANHPVSGSNTYIFYEAGSTGVCVEADPSLFAELSKVRKNDKCLNVGVTFDDRREADFYVFPLAGLNTLSKEEAEYREKHGSYKVESIIKIPLKTINEVIEENFDKTPDLISIDIEGIDLDVLKSLDFDKYRPLAICVETITYSENRKERKITEILDFVTSKGYFVYADTHINTIFVNQEKFSDPNIKVKLW
jgi:FkbM family methyltransferase